MRTATRFVSLVVVAVLSVVGVVHAAPGAVLVGGRASQQDQLLASDAVASAASAEGWSIANKTYPANTVTAAEKCLLDHAKPWACVSGLLREDQIRLVAIVTLRPKPGNDGGTDIEISERLVIADMDSLLVGQRTCEQQCTPDRLRTIAAGLTTHLLSRAAIKSGRTALAVTSTPAGAFVSIDAVRVGFTDFSRPIAPGSYTVAVELDGHKSALRNVRVREGTTESVSFILEPLETTPSKHPGNGDDHPRRGDNPGKIDKPKKLTPLVPGAIAVVGLTALSVGIVQLWRDEDAAAPGQPVRPSYNDTGTQGFYLTVGGGAALVGAAVIWWKFSKSSATPIVAPVTGGAVVGVVRSF